MTTERFRLDLGDGHYLVGDELAGDGPSYVFLHGLGSVREGEKSASLLEHAKSRGRGFLRFDMRGHGESSGRLGQIKVSGLIDDVVRVLERTGPAILIGSSLGGLVGTHAAVQRPELVHRLVLLAPAFGLMPRLGDRLDANGCLSHSDGQTFFVEPDVLEDAHSIDERSLPERLKVPTLFVHGTDDDVIPTFVSESFYAAMPSEHKQLWIVANGDHRLNTVATEIWQRIDEFQA